MGLHESISVAMCTYNGERYLRDQLASIANQTALPLELVICDDCSIDSTPHIVAEFARSAPFPVKFIQNPSNLGVSKNFENAMSRCSGKLIALCDQDDIWFPKKLSVQAARFESDSSLGGLFSDALLVDSEAKPLGRTLWQLNSILPSQQRRVQLNQAASVLLTQNVVTGWTLMFRADLVPEFCPVPPGWIHDHWIAWVIALYSRLDLVPEPLGFYRLHSDQQTGISIAPLEKVRGSQRTASAEYRAIALQFQDLCRYLDDRPGSVRDIWKPLIQRKIAHLTMRAGLPHNRFARLVRMIPQLNNYRKFSKGWRSLLKDLII